MRRRLNLLLSLILLACAVSIWAGRGGRIPWRGLVPAAGPSPDAGFDADGELPAVHLLILNGTGRGGLAREAGLLVPRLGCVAESIGNAPEGEHPVSFLINRRLDRERALDLARRLGGLPLLEEWDGRGTEDAVLVLGGDHARVMEALGRPK